MFQRRSLPSVLKTDDRRVTGHQVYQQLVSRPPAVHLQITELDVS